MGKKHEKVSEFREVIEKALRDQVLRADQERRSWPDYKRVAVLSGYLYVKAAPIEGRPHVMGLSKNNQWGVVTPEMRFGRYTGHLAVVSTATQTDSLARRWSFNSSTVFGVDSERPLLSLASITNAIEWAKAPLTNSIILDELAQLTKTEQKAVDSKMADNLESGRELQADLDRITSLHRMPLPDVRLD